MLALGHDLPVIHHDDHIGAYDRTITSALMTVLNR